MPTIPPAYEATTLRDGVVSLGMHAFPRDALGDDTVVIKPDYIGICRADAKEVLGSRDVMEDRGPLFGHELVGTVSFSGARTAFHEGDIVTLNPNITPARTTGFAEYVFVRGAEEQLNQAVIQVPESGIRGQIWMPEPLACIVHALGKLLELAHLKSLHGKRVGIIGAGCSGLMFAMHARHLGASVSVFNRRKMRRIFAQEQGILAENEIHPLAEARDHRNEFDVVIVAPSIATAETLEVAAGMAVDGAVVFVYGGTRKGDTFPIGQVDVDTVRRREGIEPAEYRGKKLHIAGAYGCLREDYEEGFRLHAEHPDAFPLERLTSKVIGLHEFPQVIMAVAAEKEDYPGKVLIETAPHS
ncbi:alcohol dehydrogenase catalytic domain-containing protein [Streptomyces verrucosisporus]|uniref:alcohol dehydrogenase catalytic domain-containing protein n=1 Tax=Streptomyces verrucosisporus TaxID=1695161 RepID=UPI0019D31735|nr:alcohol dehydrogenase catalytic domain-containing protein [Streptomyces verrucosisporus]MBN3932890.1 alcohol dehydrogenase catalytic domain-containing protein [Streptomyces verrucosisporus]